MSWVNELIYIVHTCKTKAKTQERERKNTITSIGRPIKLSSLHWKRKSIE